MNDSRNNRMAASISPSAGKRVSEGPPLPGTERYKPIPILQIPEIFIAQVLSSESHLEAQPPVVPQVPASGGKFLFI